MAASDLLIVEDGTNVPDANSYVTLTEFLAYCTLYAYTEVLDDTEEAQVAALVKATDLLESYTYRGIRTYATQNLEFPRMECFPAGASAPISIYEIPKAIKRAQMAAAVISAQGIDLQPNVQPGGFVTKEKVGPIETEYADGVANGMTMPVFSAVDALVADYLQIGGGNGRYSLRTLRV